MMMLGSILLVFRNAREGRKGQVIQFSQLTSKPHKGGPEGPCEISSKDCSNCIYSLEFFSFTRVVASYMDPKAYDFSVLISTF